MTTAKYEAKVAEAKELMARVGDLSEEALDYIGTRADQACLNWLTVYGIPETPYEVWSLFRSVYKTSWLMMEREGLATLTDKALASEEEKAARPASDQLTLDGLLSAVTEGEAKPAHNHGGLYL